MTKQNITASVTVEGLTYTGTIDRQSRSARPVAIECGEQRWTGEWQSEFGFIQLDDGQEMPEQAKTELDAALDNAMSAALGGR